MLIRAPNSFDGETISLSSLIVFRVRSERMKTYTFASAKLFHKSNLAYAFPFVKEKFSQLETNYNLAERRPMH